MASKISKAPVGPNKGQALDLGFMGSREEAAESRNIESRKRLREQVSSEIAAFLERGGKINQIEAHVTADPPQKPVGYGHRPI